MPDADGDKPVRRVGDYEFLDRLAVGGMGEVWRVRHVTLGAIYVAKVLRPEYREDEQFLRRFLHEARLVANLRHPNIVQVFGYDTEHTLYLMEYVEGIDLDHLLRSKRILTYEEKRIVIEAVADTIGYAHREVDLIHRDIKPSNVLIAIRTLDDPIKRSSIKLTDFGIARLLSASQRVTMSSGMVMGTLHYMAPEQFEGDADKRSDVYSIGVLYYQLLTGSIPFDGPTAFVIRDKHVNDVPPAPHELDPDVPLADSVVVMRCLEKDPDRRYQDAAELYDALMSAEPGTGGVARTIISQGGSTAPVDRTQVTDQPGARRTETEETLLTAGAVRRATAGTPGPPTAGTIPAIHGEPTPGTGAAPVPERETEPTVYAAAKPRRGRRLLRTAAVAVASLVVLALLATVLLKPRYQLVWSTIRSDPLDTPRGIRVAVAPKAGFGLWWMDAGTIDEEAPPNWANWTTWFESIDVRFSDGLYREFTITCRREACKAGQPVPAYDFGGATFEQVAEAHDAEVVEDLSKVGEYVNAVLTPKGLATTQTLPDVRRCLVRVDDLEKRAAGIEFDRSRLETYRAAVAALVETADALGDGDTATAETAFGKAEAAIEAIDLGGLAALPDDFLFRTTLRSAIAQLKARADKADRFVRGLEPLSGTSRDVEYTLSKYTAARGAVAQYFLSAPGRAGYKAALEKIAAAPGDVAPMLDDLGEAAPPPFRVVRSYLAKLDLLLDHTPEPKQARAFRVGVLQLLDQAAASAPSVQPDTWPDQCFEAGQLASREALVAFWQRLHQSRFAKAAQRCRQVARDALRAAGAQADAQEAVHLLTDAEACLDALRQAKLASDEERRAAAGLLSTCCVRHAMALFNVGSGPAAKAGEHLDTVRRLLDRGLDELGGCEPDVQAQGRGLREILKVVGEARARLADACRQNFGEPGSYGGEPKTLLAALDAWARLGQILADHAGHPCTEAARGPFVSIAAEACDGFSLPNAAAVWLLGRALEACQKGDYTAAAAHLETFQRVPGEGEPRRSSPLRRLLAKPLLDLADAVHRVAALYAEAKPPGQAPPDAARWRPVWDKRLEAKSHLDIAIPQKPEPGNPAEAKQWAAIHALMRTILDHYRQRVDTETELRRLEADAAKLFIREGETVKANPETATPEALQRTVTALEALEDGGWCKSDDHPTRLAAVRKELSAITTIRTGSKDRILALIAKPDPQAALDRIATARAVLGKEDELALTRQAVAAWTKLVGAEAAKGEFAAALAAAKAMREHQQVQRHAADKGIAGHIGGLARDAVTAWKQAVDADIGGGRYDEALAKLAAIGRNPEVKRLAADPAVQKALQDVPSAVLYCQGQRLLATGPDGLAEAVPKFQQAGAYRDAQAIVAQVGPFLEAAKLKETAPFKAWARFDELSKAEALPAGVRAAAGGAAKQIGESLVLAAVNCTQAFSQALVKGGWEDYIGEGVNPRQEAERIRTFLAQVEKLAIEQTGVVGRAKLICDTRQVRITTKRRVSFAYKLHGAPAMPVVVEQQIEWTVRHLPPAERKGRAWIIEAWEEAY